MGQGKTKTDRAAVMRSAWVIARASHDRAKTIHWYSEDRKPARAPRLPYTVSVRAFFAQALVEAWRSAKEGAAYATLPVERRAAIEAAEMDLLAANCIDSTREALPVIAAAQARLNEVRAA